MSGTDSSSVPGRQTVARMSGRVIVAGPEDLVLLMRFVQDTGERADAFWLTPGGGVQPGETTAMAAARELAEETGILAGPGELGPVVAESRGRWSDGEIIYDAQDVFFFLHVADLAVDISGQEDLERSLCTGHRWWRLGDLLASGEKIYPPGLPALAGLLLTGEQPSTPVQMPWR